ncbi:MAG: protein-glutamate O-methyltransferase [Planctomycetes bacterium]|nr:protein-glutamate O-methyltransferase [Planctomycetota bacterium]
MDFTIPYTPELTDDLYRRIAEAVKKACGINLEVGKRELVRARLAKRLRALGLPDYESYVDFLRRDDSGEEFSTMLDVLSTNVTSFFREPKHFEYLAEAILGPRIRAATGAKTFRAWSAGCSSGEEPYTIAIVLAEAIKNPTAWDVKVLATDLSRRVLARAREGLYDPAALGSMPEGIRQRHFVSIGSGEGRRFRVADATRRIVTFAPLNLIAPWPMRGPFDIIFCRNVMIYFDKETQGRIIARFWDILGSGGYLFVGHSESLAGIRHSFRYVQPTVYRKP